MDIRTALDTITDRKECSYFVKDLIVGSHLTEYRQEEANNLPTRTLRHALHTCMYACRYARTYVCMNVLACVYVCICICKYVSMDVCIYVCNRMYYPCNSIRELGWPLNGLIRGITGHHGRPQGGARGSICSPLDFAHILPSMALM